MVCASQRLWLVCSLVLCMAAPAVAQTAPKVRFQTSLGDFVVEVYPDKAPKTVENFLQYVKDKHYDGTIFHRVIPNFMVQGGGYDSKYAEKKTRPPVVHEGREALARGGSKNVIGTLAMARTNDPQSATAQFFINVQDNAFLDPTLIPPGDPVPRFEYQGRVYKDTPRGTLTSAPQLFGYTVFGRVVSGMETIIKIKDVPTGSGGMFQTDVPKTQIVINSATMDGESWRARVATEVPAPPIKAPVKSNEADATGSGFRISHNTFVTNHHVIEGCGRVHVNGSLAQLKGFDPRSDLALLEANLSGAKAFLRSEHAPVGEALAVAGFPLRGLLSGFNLTTGNLSSLSGIGGDTRLVQISAPVQTGNSGGPVVDSAGNVVGVVVSKLNALRSAKLTGDIPQNVNFAINVNVLRSFLEAHSVEYKTASSLKLLPTTEVAAKAKGFTVLIECWN